MTTKSFLWPDMYTNFEELLLKIQGKQTITITEEQINLIKEDILLQNDDDQLQNDFWKPEKISKSLHRLNLKGHYEDVFYISQILGWNNPFSFTHEVEENLKIEFQKFISIYWVLIGENFPRRSNLLPLRFILSKFLEDTKKSDIHYIWKFNTHGRSKQILYGEIWDAFIEEQAKQNSMNIKGADDI